MDVFRPWQLVASLDLRQCQKRDVRIDSCNCGTKERGKSVEIIPNVVISRCKSGADLPDFFVRESPSSHPTLRTEEWFRVLGSRQARQAAASAGTMRGEAPGTRVRTEEVDTPSSGPGDGSFFDEHISFYRSIFRSGISAKKQGAPLKASSTNFLLEFILCFLRFQLFLENFTDSADCTGR